MPAVAAFLRQAGLPQFAAVSLFGGYSLNILGWVIVLYFGVTLGAYLCWFKAMEHGSTFLGSLTYFVKPAVSPSMAWIFLGEAVTARIAAGIVLLLVSAAVSLKKDKAGA